MGQPQSQPRPALSIIDAAAIIVGIVIGGGIFKLPSLVAGSVTGSSTFIAVWVAGGVISLLGALTYAELAAAYPDAGGDYHYLTRAYGRSVGFLFAWARLMVIQTGSIALQAFIFGDYAMQILPLGPHSSAVYAALAVIGFTLLNIAGIQSGKAAQNALTACVVLGLLMVVIAGFIAKTPSSNVAAAAASTPWSFSALGMAMVFVLLTYGGWNEAAYLSAEMRGGRRSIVAALMLGIAMITALYVLVNLAYLRGLGLSSMAASPAVAADLLERALGRAGAIVVSATIVVAVLSTLNGTILTGARTNYALGRDFPLLGILGRWEGRGSSPMHALLAQGIIALLLVLIGSVQRTGFAHMVDYTAPVFWLFFLLTGVAAMLLRGRDPNVPRPFRTPLFPITPLLFCIACGYMLYSSLAYVRLWALAGVGVLATGVPLLWLALRSRRNMVEWPVVAGDSAAD